MFRYAFAILFSIISSAAVAQDRVHETASGQISAPVGLTVQVRSLTVGDSLTKVDLIASFDGRASRLSADLNGNQNAYISWGPEEQERIYLRRVAANPQLTIENGQTMQGELIFPGVIPAGVQQVELVFNPGFRFDHPRAPGINLPLELAE